MQRALLWAVGLFLATLLISILLFLPSIYIIRVPDPGTTPYPVDYALNGSLQLTDATPYRLWVLPMLFVGCPAIFLLPMILGPMAAAGAASYEKRGIESSEESELLTTSPSDNQVFSALLCFRTELATLFGLMPGLIVAGVYLNAVLINSILSEASTVPAIAVITVVRSLIAWSAIIINCWGNNLLAIVLGFALANWLRKSDRAVFLSMIISLVIVLLSLGGSVLIERATDFYLVINPARQGWFDVPIIPIALYGLTPYIATAVLLVRLRQQPAT